MRNTQVTYLISFPASVSCSVSECGNCLPWILGKVFHLLLCNACKGFPNPGSRHLYSIFQKLPEKLFQNLILSQNGRKKKRSKQGTYTRRAVLRTLNDTVSLKTRKYQTYPFPAHYFSLFAVLASFGLGHPESSPPVSIL